MSQLCRVPLLLATFFFAAAPATASKLCLDSMRQLLRLERQFVPAAALNRGVGTRDLGSLSELRVVSYNVLDLLESPGRVVDQADGTRVWQPASLAKPQYQLQGVARAIKELDGDLVVVMEVESRGALSQLANEYLEGAWHPLLIQGNGTRHIGFLVKRDLPLSAELISHRHITWTHPETGKTKRVFSKDAPALVLRDARNDQPLLAIVGVHNVPQRHREGDSFSSQLRRAQTRAQLEIMTQLRESLGPQVPVMQAGDFNRHIPGNPEFHALRRAGYEEAFEYFEQAPPPHLRSTHSYLPNQGPAQHTQLDGFFVHEDDASLLQEVGIYQYPDSWGLPLPLPRTKAEREQNPSDHLPISLTLDFQLLLQRLHSPVLPRLSWE